MPAASDDSISAPAELLAHGVTLSDGTVLALRRLQPDVAPAFHAAVLETVIELTRWFDWCHEGWTLDECRAMLAHLDEDQQAGRSVWLALCEGPDRVVGAVWLNRLDPQHRFANLGYWVRTSAAGRGIATAAAEAIARYGFDALRLTRLEIVVDVENRASQRVAEKLRARREGVLRWRLVHHGQPHDAVMYALLAQARHAIRI